MSIIRDSVVSLRYEMYDANNQLLDKTEGPIAYLHDGYNGIFPSVEKALHGENVGDTVEMALSPDDAFGEQGPELVRIENASVFPVEIEVDMTFEADDLEASDVLIYRVADIANDKAVVNGSHPSAGMKILFKAIVKGVRDATGEEVAHGHVRGPRGRHHH